MIIERTIHKHTVYTSQSLREAIEKTTREKLKIIFVISEDGKLEGVLTGGDIQRWMLSQEIVDLNASVETAMNTEYKFARIFDSPLKIEAQFGNDITVIPIIDEFSNLKSIAFKRRKSLAFGDVELNEKSPCYTIAEIGINHNGDFELAKKLIKLAKDSGADCAKFQMRDMASLYNNSGVAGDATDDLGTQYTMDLLTRFNLPPEDMFKLFDYCKELGLEPLCTPWDLHSLEQLEEYGMRFYKVASADMTNHELLARLAETGKPLIISTGMSDSDEIKEAVQLLRRKGVAFALLHCNSTYPAPYKDVHLNYMKHLADIGECLVGYSGHERGFHIPLAAVAMGAKIIEKHFTIDRNMEGNDHKVSLLPDEFKDMVDMIKDIEQSMGSDSNIRQITQGERMNRENLAKSLVAANDIEQGAEITEQVISVRSPGKGLQPNKINDLIGRRAKRPMKAGDFFYPDDLSDTTIQRRPYTFRRPFGVPVRFHDFKELGQGTNLDFLEFHLSYNDMDMDWHACFDQKLDCNLVVHSPDLFKGDHILNFAEKDKEYRKRSIAELQRVIETTREMQPYFNTKGDTLIVVSLGGFTEKGPLEKSELGDLYKRVQDGLADLDTKGVEIIAQTLPPFPWYLGGQLYCNLFVDPEDTVEFCQQSGTRLCFDVAHSKLAMNYRKRPFSEYIDLIAPYTAHLHIVDAEGVDGEGLQVGEGEIDFRNLAQILDKKAANIGFIPEIWQGHKNNGEGFWLGLERLENWF
ncbi:MAG: acetylneuraminic acid synthetase [Zetaproteobacteria bacterium]|nr:MAG: acetylneuraminic acid synthetase [Zetaproteobacteria bacterium]